MVNLTGYQDLPKKLLESLYRWYQDKNWNMQTKCVNMPNQFIWNGLQMKYNPFHGREMFNFVFYQFQFEVYYFQEFFFSVWTFGMFWCCFSVLQWSWKFKNDWQSIKFLKIDQILNFVPKAYWSFDRDYWKLISDLWSISYVTSKIVKKCVFCTFRLRDFENMTCQSKVVEIFACSTLKIFWKVSSSDSWKNFVGLRNL